MELSCEKITVDFVGLRALDKVSLSLKTFPKVGFNCPPIVFNKVVLPEPFGPIKPKISFVFRDKETLSRALRPTKSTVIFSHDSSIKKIEKRGKIISPLKR